MAGNILEDIVKRLSTPETGKAIAAILRPPGWRGPWFAHFAT
jgi:hypothetical protein